MKYIANYITRPSYIANCIANYIANCITNYNANYVSNYINNITLLHLELHHQTTSPNNIS